MIVNRQSGDGDEKEQTGKHGVTRQISALTRTAGNDESCMSSTAGEGMLGER